MAADLNQFYSILKGVAASGESVSLIYNAAGALILQPSSDPAVGTQLYQLKNNAGTVKAAMTAGGGALFSSQVLLAQSSTISSAGTTDLSTATGNYAQISGTTTITAFGTVQAGTVMVLEFQGILTLTHNATSLILRAGANATTAAGDIYGFVSEGSGNWRELWHLTASTTADFVQLASTTLGSAAATITFSSISGSYKSLQLVFQGRGDTAATSTTIAVTFNSDTGANYDYEVMSASSATPSASETRAAVNILVAQMAAANSAANAADSFVVTIANYAGTTFQKSLLSQYQIKQGTAAGNIFSVMTAGWWRSTAAITSITLTAGAGNFVTGTTAQLYGLR